MGVPHKGWRCVDVVDLRADGESADETDYATCQMCGKQKIATSTSWNTRIWMRTDVGCVCCRGR